MAIDVYDLQVNADGDLVIDPISGDFAVVESTLQHQEHLQLAVPGEYNQWPTTGIAVRDFILGDISEGEYRQRVNKNFEEDGMDVNKIKVTAPQDVEIEAGYREEEVSR
jgi:hypothetical protein